MAKQLKDKPITKKELAEFVANDSDFAFEMRVLAQLRSLKFECQHSGTYQDPVSDKIRQFDIRAVMNQSLITLALAVECKNFRPNHPLLMSVVPRTTTEAFHDLLDYKVSLYSASEVVSVKGAESAYKPGEMVGKKTDQVGRTADGSLLRDDSATFDKLSQAVSSCNDLVREFVLKGPPPYVRAIVPVLVVPAGRLWQVDYSADGGMLVSPRQVPRTTLYYNQTWTVDRGTTYGSISYHLSHLEVVTLDALADFVDGWHEQLLADCKRMGRHLS